MMEPNEHHRFEQLARAIDPHARLLRTWPLHGGVSAQMTALELSLPDDEIARVIVRRPAGWTIKRNPHAAADQFKLLQITERAGLPTQKPHFLDESGTILSTPCLVIEYVEGKPELAPRDSADFVSQLAEHLARIHAVDTSNLDLSFLPRRSMGSSDVLGEQYRDSTSIERRIREALQEVEPAPQANDSVLLHGDFWPGNVIWKDGEVAAVIDWEDAEVGDPLVDLAVSRLEILWVSGVGAMNDFTRRYASITGVDLGDLAYWDLRTALRSAPRLAEWSIVYPSLGRHDLTEETMREGLSLFVNQALEEPVAAVIS
jgi:aminoglycoside phosphotransferase (APT) family kinase protein